MEPPAPDRPPASPGPRTPSGARFALAVFLLLPLGVAAQARARLPGLIWTELFVILLPAVGATVAWGLRPREWLRLAPPGWRPALLAPVVALAGMVAAGSLQAIARMLAPEALAARFDVARLFDAPAAEQAALAAVAVILAPVCEEVAFRGHLAASLHARLGPAGAIAGSALAFAAFHLDPIRFPGVLLLGALYGWMAWRSGSIWPAVIAHAVQNGLATAAFVALAGDLPDLAAADRPAVLRQALATAAIGFPLLALAAAAFGRGLPMPPARPPAFADPAPDARGLRWSRVPGPLWAVAAAGWLAFGAILATPWR